MKTDARDKSAMPLLKRRHSPILLRYISVGFLVPFFCSVLVFIALFLLKDVLDDVSDFIEKGVSFKSTALYYLARQPANLVNVIPVAILLGTSFLTMTLGRCNELTAMRAAGLSLAKCALPIWITAIISCGVVFAINEAWGSRCQELSERIREVTLDKKKKEGRLSFCNSRDNRDWSIAEIDGSGRLSGVIVRQYSEDSVSEYLLSADKAEAGDNSWIFRDGFIQYYGADGIHTSREPEFFSVKRMPFTERMDELKRIQNSGNMQNISSMRLALKSRLVTSERRRQVLRAMIWHRLTVPLASIVAALFAFSLTLTGERKGVVKGFALAVSLLVMFFACGQVGLTLAKNGYFSPFIGAALPHILFFAGAFYCMYKRQ